MIKLYADSETNFLSRIKNIKILVKSLTITE